MAVANHAESGESLPSFLAEGRLDKVLASIKPGDYLFVQFGHDDQKDQTPGAGARTTYARFLKRLVAEARQRQAKLGLAESLVGDLPRFDPSHPDPVEGFAVLASPPGAATRPEGS